MKNVFKGNRKIRRKDILHTKEDKNYISFLVRKYTRLNSVISLMYQKQGKSVNPANIYI